MFTYQIGNCFSSYIQRSFSNMPSENQKSSLVLTHSMRLVTKSTFLAGRWSQKSWASHPYRWWGANEIKSNWKKKSIVQVAVPIPSIIQVVPVCGSFLKVVLRNRKNQKKREKERLICLKYCYSATMLLDQVGMLASSWWNSPPQLPFCALFSIAGDLNNWKQYPPEPLPAKSWLPSDNRPQHWGRLCASASGGLRGRGRRQWLSQAPVGPVSMAGLQRQSHGDPWQWAPETTTCFPPAARGQSSSLWWVSSEWGRLLPLLPRALATTLIASSARNYLLFKI